MQLEELKNALLMELKRYKKRQFSLIVGQPEKLSEKTLKSNVHAFSPYPQTIGKFEYKYNGSIKSDVFLQAIIREVKNKDSIIKLTNYLFDLLENKELPENLQGIIKNFLALNSNTVHHYIVDFIKPNDKVFITQSCAFSDELYLYAQKFGFIIINIETVSEDDVWLRDYYYTTTDQGDGSHQTYTPPQQSALTYNEQKIIANSYGAARKNKYFIDGKLLKTLPNPPGQRYSTVPVPKKSKFIKSKVQIEGGNLISAEIHNQHKYIIGEASLINTATQLRFNKAPFNLQENFSMYSLKKHSSRYDSAYFGYVRELAKREIQRALKLTNSTELIVVPQWVFHIDLQMAYLGNGQFLLHSFEMTKELLKSQTEIKDPDRRVPINSLHFKQHLESIISNLIENNDVEQTIVNEINRKLTKHGFEVFLCAGALFGIQNTPQVQKLWLTNFFNGIAGKDNQGNRYFLTNASPYKWLQKPFEDLLKQLDINVFFLNVNDNLQITYPLNPYQKNSFEIKTKIRADSKEEKTVFYINEYRGGLRCQTALKLALQEE